MFSNVRKGLLLAGALMLAVAPAAVRAANEAQGAGRTADITWIDAEGRERTASATRIWYVYYDRAYLSVPKDGKSYRDSERKTRAFPTLTKKAKFGKIDRAEFRWETNEKTGTSLLIIKLFLRNGRTEEITGNTLAGASHPLSPFLRFMAGGQAHRIEIHPLGSEEALSGGPRLVTVKFTT